MAHWNNSRPDWSYSVKLPNGNAIRRHVDHLREYVTRQPETPTSVEEQTTEPSEFVDTPTDHPEAGVKIQPHRYPERDRQPPDRLMNFST